MKTAIVAAAIVLASAVSASAQTNSPAPNTGRSTAAPSSSAAQDQANAPNEPLRQQVRDNLAKAGFTDIRVMPTSFMVRAKDQSGNPVMMVINPDSFTEVTAIPSTQNPSSAPHDTSSSATQKH